MVVFEVGIINSGSSAYRLNFQPIIDGDITFQTALVSAVQNFSKEMFGDEAEELRLKNLTLCMKAINSPLDKNLSIYAIADKNLKSIDAIKRALSKTGKRITRMITKSPNLFSDESTQDADKFSSIFNDEFKKLKPKPKDRARNLFG